MKKLLVLVLVLALAFVAVPRAAAADYWTGNPDPMKCNQFLDCRWVVPVCIDGTTYQIGLYFDPALAAPEEIEAMALYWTNTVLTAGVCPWVGYSVPWVLLYTSAELTNGYGILVSTEAFASKENIMSAFKLTTIPADLKQICAGPVAQMYPDDTQGKWACDPNLVGILANGHSGLRLPLISDTGPSLQKVYEQVLSWIK